MTTVSIDAGHSFFFLLQLQFWHGDWLPRSGRPRILQVRIHERRECDGGEKDRRADFCPLFRPPPPPDPRVIRFSSFLLTFAPMVSIILIS